MKILRALATANIKKHFQSKSGTAVGIDQQAEPHLLRLLRHLPRLRMLVLRQGAEVISQIAGGLQVQVLI